MLQALIVDDDRNTAKALATLVEKQGFAVRTAASLGEARRQLEGDPPDIVLADLMLPDGTGFELLEALSDRREQTDVVLITGHATVETAVQALRQGASDYLTKPVDIARLVSVLTNLSHAHQMRSKIRELRGRLRELGRFGPLVGSAPAMQTVYDMISRVAPTDATVLLTGESGTGKELAGEAIHQLSRRTAQPCLSVNCAAVSPTLIESELFGHERGSFTGADRTHRGYFERADGGTLVLDEVGEMPLEAQVKLLRVLETGGLNRVGGDKVIACDVRIVAATNSDLDAAVAAGKFRRDLLYRLKVFPIRMPPLRERGEDIPALAQYFLSELNRREDAHKRIAPAALAALERYSWPGNVRELRNVVHRAFILAADEIGPTELAPEVSDLAPPDDGRMAIPPGLPLAELERHHVQASLRHFGGDKRRTAEALGISLKTLYNRLREYRS